MSEWTKEHAWKACVVARLPWVRIPFPPPDHSIGLRMHYVYFLLLSNRDIYKGSTDDLKRRFDEHRSGKVTSTKNFRPVMLIGYEAYKEKTDAQRKEKFLKTTEGRRLLKQQYRDVLKKLEFA